MNCISEKDMKPMVKDLKKIYKADNEKMALYYLQEAKETWGSKYKVVFKS